MFGDIPGGLGTCHHPWVPPGIFTAPTSPPPTRAWDPPGWMCPCFPIPGKNPWGRTRPQPGRVGGCPGLGDRDSRREEVVGTRQPHPGGRLWPSALATPRLGLDPEGHRLGQPMATAVSLSPPEVWHTRARAPTQRPKHTLPLGGAHTPHPHNVSFVPTAAGTCAVPLHLWGGQKALQTRGAPQSKPRHNTKKNQGWGPQSVALALGRVHL